MFNPFRAERSPGKRYTRKQCRKEVSSWWSSSRQGKKSKREDPNKRKCGGESEKLRELKRGEFREEKGTVERLENQSEIQKGGSGQERN